MDHLIRAHWLVEPLDVVFFVGGGGGQHSLTFYNNLADCRCDAIDTQNISMNEVSTGNRKSLLYSKGVYTPLAC